MPLPQWIDSKHLPKSNQSINTNFLGYVAEWFYCTKSMILIFYGFDATFYFYAIPKIIWVSHSPCSVVFKQFYINFLFTIIHLSYRANQNIYLQFKSDVILLLWNLYWSQIVITVESFRTESSPQEFCFQIQLCLSVPGSIQTQNLICSARKGAC